MGNGAEGLAAAGALSAIATPALVLDLPKLEQNIERMADC